MGNPPASQIGMLTVLAGKPRTNPVRGAMS
jgi:hypothetical protein